MKQAMLLMVLIGAVLVGLLLLEVDLAEVWSHLRGIGGGGFVALFIVYVLRTLVDATAWLFVLPSLPVTPRWIWRITALLLAGGVLEKTTPLAGFGGAPMKIVVLKRFYGVDYTAATASLVLRRTTDVAALAIFIPAAFLLGARAEIVDAVGTGMAIAGLIGLFASAVLFFAVQRLRVFSRIRRRIDGGRSRSAAVMQMLDAIEGVESSLVDFYRHHPVRFAGSLVTAVLEIVVGVVAVYLSLRLLGQPASPTSAVVVEAFVLFVTAIFFFVPANVGTQDGALVLACSAIFGSPALGVALAAIRRARDLAWLGAGVIIGSYYSIAREPRVESRE